MVKVSLFNELDKKTGEKLEEKDTWIELGIFNHVQWTYGLIRLNNIDDEEEEIYLKLWDEGSILYKGKVFGDFLIEGV